MTTYRIAGNTYTHRAMLRQIGAQWDADRKVWTIDIVDHGFRRTDGLLYRELRQPGLRVERDDR